ncbi:amidohydrolase family protein [Nonomuraea sp. NPDC050536]|uniref:amidohydrolase family protein n=1 Tax=Nonomuraea sp. NPDC050536 TaxID=3364366 RepID=UPI0037C4F859
MESLLWVLPVDKTGRPTGPARQVTRELSDSPTWAGDSTTLLYLNGRRLKTVNVDGTSGRSIPVQLSWRNDPGPDQVVIHAGRMWDGVKQVSSHYHYPAIAMGGDQTEHVGATNRFGYSRTVTNVGSAYSDVLSMFNASKMARTPTLFSSSTLYKEDTDERVRRLYPNWRMAKLQASVTSAQTTDQTVIRANLANQVAQLVAMIRGGGVVTAGTDAPIDHLAVSLHMNLGAMVKYGLTPLEALTSATGTSGRYLGQPLGRIGKGMYADLAIVDGDPLSRIEDAANVTAAVVGGRHHTVEQLLAPYPSSTATDQAAPGALAPPGKIKARVPAHPSTAGFWWNNPTELERARVSCDHDH